LTEKSAFIYSTLCLFLEIEPYISKKMEKAPSDSMMLPKMTKKRYSGEKDTNAGG
jgi:hypothetical protein